MILGIFFALMAAVGWGTGDVFVRRAIAHIPLRVVLTVVMVITMLSMGALGLFIDGVGAFSPPLVFFAWVALMALFSYVTGQWLQYLSLSRTGATIIAPIIGTQSIFAVILGVTLGGERPNLPSIIGAIAVVTGVVIVLSDRNRVLR